jgi:glutathione S-transferase
MFTLYGNPGAASMAPHVMLIEANAPHEIVMIDFDRREQFDAAYLRINPHARVPTLIENGRTMYESAAITIYLGERFPETRLVPAAGAPERAAFLQWMAYLTNTVQEAHMHYWHAEHYLDSEPARREMMAVAERRLGALWDHIDGVLAQSGPYLAGPACTVADIYLTMLTRWSRKLNNPATTRPQLRRLVDLVKARPAYQAMLKAEGIEQ